MTSTPLGLLTYWLTWPEPERLRGKTTHLLQRAVAEYIYVTSSEDIPPFLQVHQTRPGPPTPFSVSWPPIDNPAVVLQFLSDPTAAQALGCGPLSLAVLAHDEGQIKYLLDNYPATIEERNLFGQSPLHLAANKPSCLRLLIKVADDQLLNELDADGLSPLDTALLLSVFHCLGAPVRCSVVHELWMPKVYGPKKCRRCRCAECAIILLKADCAVPMHEYQPLLDRCSQRCRLRYVKALKNRRDRLKKLALDHLTTAEAEQLGLLSPAVLDGHAWQALQLLQQRRVHIPAALNLGVLNKRRPRSVYGRLKNPTYAEIFFQHGFYDTDVWREEYNSEDVGVPGSQLPLAYIEWLDNHGADAILARLVPLPNGCGVFTAHATFHAVGLHLGNALVTSLANSPWMERLQSALLRPDLADDCQCACSVESCTPLTFLLKGMCKLAGCLMPETSNGILNCLIIIFELFGTRLEMHHHLACLRFLTFQALGIPHTCCGVFLERDRFSTEEAQDIRNEHAFELELLEELLKELEGEMVNTLQNPNGGLHDLEEFWKQTWLNRLKIVWEQLDGDELSPVQRREAEEIGVVWNRPTPLKHPVTAGSNPHARATTEYWAYELWKIESECQ
ncbi:hypothetical protein VTI28DRAFT_3487 [Corynascus sepedonium]